MLTSSRNRKVPVATIDGYSRNSTYTQTFFHYPSRNPHTQLHYESRYSKKPIKTFRLKGKTDFKQYMHESSRHPLPHNHSHFQKPANVTGDRKKDHPYSSHRATDPVTLTYEARSPQPKYSAPFEPSYLYQMEVERQHYLPSQRQLSHSRKQYYSQQGFSQQARDIVRPREAINNSSSMCSIIQYSQAREMNRPSELDNLKYNSRK